MKEITRLMKCAQREGITLQQWKMVQILYQLSPQESIRTPKRVAIRAIWGFRNINQKRKAEEFEAEKQILEDGLPMECLHGKGWDEHCETCAPTSEGSDVIHRPSFDGGGGMYSAPEDLPTTDYIALYMQQADLVSKLVTDLTEANSEIQSMKQSRPPLIHADDTWAGAINGVLKQARIYDLSDQDFEIACRMGMAAFRKARDYNARLPHDPEWRGATPTPNGGPNG